MTVSIEGNMSFVKEYSKGTLFGNPVELFVISEKTFQKGMKLFQDFCNKNEYSGIISDYQGYCVLRISKKECPLAVVEKIIPGTMENEQDIKDCFDRMQSKMNENIKNSRNFKGV